MANDKLNDQTKMTNLKTSFCAAKQWGMPWNLLLKIEHLICYLCFVICPFHSSPQKPSVPGHQLFWSSWDAGALDAKTT